MIDGVKVVPLKQIADERGKIMHMLKSTDPHYIQFGEIYFSCAWPGTIKAWHIHKRMILNYAVPHGEIRFVLYDDRPDSPTKGEIHVMVLGPDNYCLVTVPPMIWNGFRGMSNETSIVANCATIPHDPDEIVRLDPMDSYIPYDWTTGNK
mgnify:CR=1 FL=1